MQIFRNGFTARAFLAVIMFVAGVFWGLDDRALASESLTIPAACFNLESVSSTAEIGEDSVLWADHPEMPTIECVPEVGNLNGYHTLTFWIHSDQAKNARFTFQFVSDNPETPPMDYFMHQVVVNWEGWRQVNFSLADFGAVREPLGWDQIEKIRVHAEGWNATPQPDLQLFISGFRFM